MKIDMKTVDFNKNGIAGVQLYACPGMPFCKNEILRYAGCGKMSECAVMRDDAENKQSMETDGTLGTLLEECIREAEEQLNYRLCYRILPVRVSGANCDFDAFRLRSQNLAKYLNGCESVILFAATVGVGLDRLIAKYSRISPSKALMFQAIGAERIEALCDTFCEDMREKCASVKKARFSPGYGDLPLTAQKDIFVVLDCARKIGLTLNDSLLMSPTKSVTAIVGIGGNEGETIHKCSTCSLQDCAFRGVK